MIEHTLELASGQKLSNRLIKAAMTEGLAGPNGWPTPAHARLYRTWSEGGAAALITGNIMIDRRYLERAGNVIVEDDSALPALADWAAAVHAGGSTLWGQISHPGRQCPRQICGTPLAPSAIKLDLARNFGEPRAATAADIAEITERFVRTASLLQQAGFDGVQIHAAHGYLLSQFLSQRTNLRDDQWGGSLANRARLLLDVVRAVRARVGDRFTISVKLNSADFVQGGFTLEECLQVVDWLSLAKVDLLEISGGTYESLVMFSAIPEDQIRTSTRRREATFLEYAEAIKQVAIMPVMVTGGFRTSSGMKRALQQGTTDAIGIARPFCLVPDLPKRLMSQALEVLPIPESELVLGSGYWGPNSRSAIMRTMNNLCQASWYYHQIECLAAGTAPEPDFSPRRAFIRHVVQDFARIRRHRRHAMQLSR
ncbi:NADH:flavin oxidoreductase [Duganella sp. CY15W]|uniref:NADH:flavin oxidoreductase/NADH oxidase family protein n=1 Tax=Duganella sp. CY15W TaxID=2692172 RepID=UPI00136A109C|nr:NADH:flavin oxidoreductase/NADH oxidase family protein [Duganella sp. CY15W]MYM26794.1 NADH:flavin oxidoreductase [Duganella sp. CY15W]